MTDDEALLAANAAYYKAFAARDLVAMATVWGEEDVSCVHPGWPVLIGAAPILASYRDIFRNARQETVTSREEKTLIRGDEGRVFCVESVGAAVLLATNWFRRSEGRWRLVHHQASPLVAPREESAPKRSFH